MKGHELSRDQHRERHEKLHRALDELWADWLRHHTTPGIEPGKFKSMDDLTVGELIRWSDQQTIDPTESK